MQRIPVKHLEHVAKSLHQDEDVIVLVSEATARELPDHGMVALGEHELRGRASHTAVYRLPERGLEVAPASGVRSFETQPFGPLLRMRDTTKRRAVSKHELVGIACPTE